MSGKTPVSRPIVPKAAAPVTQENDAAVQKQKKSRNGMVAPSNPQVKGSMIHRLSDMQGETYEMR